MLLEKLVTEIGNKKDGCMINLKYNDLELRFPSVHPRAVARINFMRTLRVPNDGNVYPLPAGLGTFPLEHIEDHKGRVPSNWLSRGGVLLPMYQSEAMWINFHGDYPVALKIGAGKINAVTGEVWKNELTDSPQNYVVLSDQPWLDGYATEAGLVRQFVATPLGQGETAEEQITGEAVFGGIQIQAFPMKKDVYKEIFEARREQQAVSEYLDIPAFCRRSSEPAMGLAPGGSITQDIHEDDYGLDAWDLDAGSRCFIHTVNSQCWTDITGQAMPTKPMSARDYRSAGMPWFSYYAEGKKALPGSDILRKLTTKQDEIELRHDAVDVGQDISDLPVIKLGAKGAVTDGVF